MVPLRPTSLAAHHQQQCCGGRVGLAIVSQVRLHKYCTSHANQKHLLLVELSTQHHQVLATVLLATARLVSTM